MTVSRVGRAVAAVAVAGLVLVGCDSGGGGSAVPSPVPYPSISRMVQEAAQSGDRADLLRVLDALLVPPDTEVCLHRGGKVCGLWLGQIDTVATLEIGNRLDREPLPAGPGGRAGRAIDVISGHGDSYARALCDVQDEFSDVDSCAKDAAAMVSAARDLAAVLHAGW